MSRLRTFNSFIKMTTVSRWLSICVWPLKWKALLLRTKWEAWSSNRTKPQIQELWFIHNAANVGFGFRAIDPQSITNHGKHSSLVLHLLEYRRGRTAVRDVLLWARRRAHYSEFQRGRPPGGSHQGLDRAMPGWRTREPRHAKRSEKLVFLVTIDMSICHPEPSHGVTE